MEADCTQEVIELHQFFQDWFNGEIEDGEASFARCAQVLAVEFTIVSPDGRMTEREALLAGLRRAYGKRGGENGRFRIWIEKPQVRRLAADLALVTYEEWQSAGSETTTRISSALFRRQEGVPQGVSWLHVHETWR